MLHFPKFKQREEFEALVEVVVVARSQEEERSGSAYRLQLE